MKRLLCALCVILLLCTGVFSPAVVMAQDGEGPGAAAGLDSAGGIRMEVSCGFNNAAKQGRYLPAHVTLTVEDAEALPETAVLLCFLVGESAADIIGSVNGIVPDKTSHQIGHILAALYSSNRLDLIFSSSPFAAFHFSGGTTDILLCTPDADKLLDIKRIGGSSDLKAGQAVDRCGVMLGLDFPCGKELEALAEKSSAVFKHKPAVKGTECSLSGLENKFRELSDNGVPDEDTAKYCLTYLLDTVKALTNNLYDGYGRIPVVYAGGVMSNRLIRSKLEESDRIFCAPEFSSDNAVGVAVYSAIKRGVIK